MSDQISVLVKIRTPDWIEEIREESYDECESNLESLLRVTFRHFPSLERINHCHFSQSATTYRQMIAPHVYLVSFLLLLSSGEMW